MNQLGTTQPWRAGVIGAGGWGGMAHIPAMNALPEYNVTAVTGSSPESAKAAADRLGIGAAYSDAKEMAAGDIDVVAVTVKVPEHELFVRETLEAGKSIYCEWPLARTTAEAEEMYRLAMEKGVRHVTGLQARGNPAVRYMRDRIAEGYVGRVLAVHATCSLPMFPTAAGAVDEAHRYLLDEANGADQLTIGAGHLLDAIEFMAAPFVDVTAYLETQFPIVTVMETGEKVRATAPDHVLIGGKLEQGAVVSVHFVNGGVTGFSLRVIGTEGELVATPRDGLMFQMDRLELRGSRGGEELKGLAIPHSYTHVPAEVVAGPSHHVAHLYAWLFNPKLAKAGDLPDFGQAVRIHRLLDAVREAASTGQRQRVG